MVACAISAIQTLLDMVRGVVSFDLLATIKGKRSNSSRIVSFMGTSRRNSICQRASASSILVVVTLATLPPSV